MANYEIDIINPKEIVVKSTDGKKTETLTITKAPSQASMLVMAARADVLQTIDLKEMFTNLGVCAPLLNITYDAVRGVLASNGKSLSAEIMQLKDSFAETLTKSLTVMSDFNTKTSDAIKGFVRAYHYLTDPKYVTQKVNGIAYASKEFQLIREKAIAMQEAAMDLANTFEAIETSAQGITTTIVAQQDADNARLEETQRLISSLNAKIKAMSDIKADLDAEVKKYDKEYDSVTAQIKKSSDQNFGLQIASAVIGGVTTLFSTAASAFSTKAAVSGVVNNAMNKGQATQQQPAGQQTGMGASGSVPSSSPENENLTKANKTIADCNKRIVEIDKRLVEIETALKDQNVADREALLKEQDTLAEEKETASKAIDDAKAQAEIYSKAITDAGAQISSKLDNMAAQAADKEALLYENLNKIADQREKAAIARRETMTTLANMTGDLANSATVVRDLKLVLQSLALATGAMRIVKVYLSDIALFWKNVEKFCDRLLEGVVKIEVEVKLNEDIEDYIPFFEDSFFVEGYITNVANWVALNMISVEYLNAFNNTRNEYKQLELSSGEGEPQMHWKRAQDNAKLLQEQITAINLV